jgi:hypothetical protein
MDGEQRFYQRPWFFPVSWTVAALIWYAIQLYRMNLGALPNYIIFIISDGMLFVFSLVIWLAFFAQFVLPVFRFRERQKIFDRLVAHLSIGHGPAMFAENGTLVASKGEKEKTGAGVVWLDSASAAQLRTNTRFTRTLGPGVHFTNHDEYIAGVVDLHQQSLRLGPQDNDETFKTKEQLIADGKSEEEFSAIQKRRSQTSALTRDSIEVIPNINVMFKIDADPVEGDGPGSRFGYRETEKAEENPVFKAIAGEGINPNLAALSREKQVVAWNKLPAAIAADLWREYLSKFTLSELFAPTQEILPERPAPLKPALHETTALYEPIVASTARNAWQDGLAELVHEVNHFLRGWVEALEREESKPASKPAPPTAPTPSAPGAPRKGTALEVINAMIRARMTQERVDELDANGKRTGVEVESTEYKWLKNRGLKVITANALFLRFTPVVEDQLVRQWNATWLNNAKAERDAIERLRKQKEFQGQERSLREYTASLSRSLLKDKPAVGKDTLRQLLTRTRDELVRHDRLHRRLTNEISEIDEILQWL